MIETHTRRNRILLLSIVLILIVTLTPGNGKIAGQYLDKVAHFIVFLFLSINICFKYYQHSRFLVFICGAIALGIITEVLQQFIPGRNMDLYDAIADTAGLLFGIYLYKYAQVYIDKLLLRIGA